ncbi:MAG: sigma-70 family RNA polymerase sigma factor [Clostridia bacterium]|nr:sigma-70 family RNA polymerase sigma factor [Clostridia bacterium]
MARRTEEKKIIADEQIIELYWNRDENAIKETDSKYGKLLFRIAYNILNDICDSEECQNDTYLGVWNAIPPTRPTVFVAFITQIMRNTAINRYKSKKNKKNIPSDYTVTIDELYNTLQSEDPVIASYEAKELAGIISSYIKELSEKEQYIFVGRYYMADSVKTIAKELKLTESTVYKALDKIKIGLKNHLIGNGVNV